MSLLLPWLLLACRSDDPEPATDASTETETEWVWRLPTADTGVEVPETTLSSFFDTREIDCTGDTWSVALRTSSPAGTALDLHIFRPSLGGAEETLELHPATLVDQHPQGTWTDWELTLAVGSEAVPGSSTVIGCDDEYILTWEADLLDYAGQILECATWGLTTERFGGCTVWTL